MGSEEARLVRDWIESGDKVRRILSSSGSKMIKKACQRISLRELARRTGLSPTYLSQVATKKTSISPEAFLKVQREVNEIL
jgi:transcriptional regulator with XRE-family HTH domain